MTHGSLVFRSKQRTHYIIYTHISIAFNCTELSHLNHIATVHKVDASFQPLSCHLTRSLACSNKRHWDCRWGAKSLGICKTLGALALSSHVSTGKSLQYDLWLQL